MIEKIHLLLAKRRELWYNNRTKQQGCADYEKNKIQYLQIGGRSDNRYAVHQIFRVRDRRGGGNEKNVDVVLSCGRHRC